MMTGRQVFSEKEKFCLQRLIFKHKLNCAARNGAGNMAAKRSAWARLAEEFNAIESNARRSEVQLKKCWDNMKTRRKQRLIQEKRDRLKMGELSNSFTIQSRDDEAHNDMTDLKILIKGDNDRIMPSTPKVTNIRSLAVDEDLKIRKEHNISQRHHEELIKLRIAEQEWVTKAAEERYHKARLEKELAELRLEKEKRINI